MGEAANQLEWMLGYCKAKLCHDHGEIKLVMFQPLVSCRNMGDSARHRLIGWFLFACPPKPLQEGSLKSDASVSPQHFGRPILEGSLKAGEERNQGRTLPPTPSKHLSSVSGNQALLRHENGGVVAGGDAGSANFGKSLLSRASWTGACKTLLDLVLGEGCLGGSCGQTKLVQGDLPLQQQLCTSPL